jgi:exoribonuclease-2
LQSGDLVGVQTRSGPRLALVVDLHGSKASLLVGFEAKPERLPLRELELICPLPPGLAPAASLGALPWQLTAESLAAATPSRRDLGAAWMLLEGEAAPLALDTLVDLLAPTSTPQALAASWLLLQRQDLFRWRQGQLQRRGVDDLRQLRRDRRKVELRESRRQHWLELLAARQPLSADQLDAAQSQPDQRADLKALQALAQGEELGPTGAELRQVLQAAGCGASSGEIRRLLSDLGLWDAHRLPSLAGTTWSAGFPDDLLAQAAALAARADEAWPGDETRVDLTRLKTVTIDDADTREIDDALSLEPWSSSEGIGPDPALGAESGPGPSSSTAAAQSPTDPSGWRIWIHVADPGRLVPAASPLDQEALRRASSLYLAGGSVPMFPPALCEGPFSLRQGKRCAAWSLAVQLDGDGAVVSYLLLRSWIKPLYRLTYDDADELIELAPPPDGELAILDGLLKRRRQWRVQQGALQMDQSEGRIRQQDGKPELEVVEPSASRLLVAEAMILAGAVVGEWGAQAGLALPYRSQADCSLPPEAELLALPPGPVRHAALRKGLSRGLTTAQPAAHFSLGLAAYVQITSPIRRYGDLIAQRQLVAQAAGAPVMPADELSELLEQLDHALRQGIQISRDDQRHWQQVWFEGHQQESFEGLFLRWLKPQDGLALVRLDALAMDLPVVVRESCEPGDGLVVKVREVDSFADLLRLTGQRGSGPRGLGAG